MTGEQLKQSETSEALPVFLLYASDVQPTGCEHEV